MPSGRFTRKASRQPPASTSAPPTDGPEAGGERRGGGPQRHAVRALGRRVGLEHERQRRGHGDRRAERLQHARGDEQLDGGRGGAGDGGEREQHDPGVERPPPADEVGEPPGGDQEGREDDVVGVQDPGERAQRGAGEVGLHVRERDVDDRRVDEREAGAGRGDGEHLPGRDPAARPDRRQRRARRARGEQRAGRGAVDELAHGRTRLMVPLAASATHSDRAPQASAVGPAAGRDGRAVDAAGRGDRSA